MAGGIHLLIDDQVAGRDEADSALINALTRLEWLPTTGDKETMPAVRRRQPAWASSSSRSAPAGTSA